MQVTSIQSATIALMNTDLRRLPFLVTLSGVARRTINQNFLVGLFFILGGLTLAALGKLNPIAAAILHNLGSLLVVFNSARLVRAGEEAGVEVKTGAPGFAVMTQPHPAAA